jgi:hypothetical protein
MFNIPENTITLAGKTYSTAELMREADDYIRLEAAEQCFALDELLKDRCALVRSTVARKKVGHKVLVDDIDWQVRATVAKYCNEPELLDKLAKDSHEFVRFVVVKRGHALELLAQDDDEEVAAIARYTLQRQRLLSDYLS